MPILVLAPKGMEADVIQAFRLGATDFLSMPIREAEVISAVERALKQVRARREREALERQLSQMNQELQRRVRELTTIFAIGKAVVSVTDQRALFDKIVEGGVYVTEADMGWLLLRDDRSKSFLLVAHQNLPRTVASRLNQPWDDGISSLVALSGETLSIHGDPLKRFKVAQLGRSALVVPVKVRNDVVGLLVALRRSQQPFGAGNQALLEAVADYASISLVNARLFKALEERARFLQQSAETAQFSERIVNETLQKSAQELRNPLVVMKGNMDMLVGNTMGKLNVEQTNTVNVMRERLKNANDIMEAMSAARFGDAARQRASTDLNDLVRQVIARFQPLAQQHGLSLVGELASRPVHVYANPSHINEVVVGYVANAVRNSPQGGVVTLRVERTKENQAHVSVQDKGGSLDEKTMAQIFEKPPKADPSATRRFGGLGIGLPLIREIIVSHGGKVWVESKPVEGTVFHFSLPLPGE